MTRALRRLVEAERRWAERPPTPPSDWPPPAPVWFAHNHAYRMLYAGADRLWRDGTVVWGRVWSAPSAMWEPGTDTRLGEVIWGDDAYLRRFPEALDDAVARFWTLRTQDVPVPGLRALAGYARDAQRVARGRVPALLSHGRVLTASAFAVYREHLPGGFLVEPLVPLLRVVGGDPPMVAVLPIRFWPTELAAEWEEGALRRASGA